MFNGILNWLQKVSEKVIWHDGDLGILSSFGFRDLSVIEVLPWDDISVLSDKYEDIDNNTIRRVDGIGGILVRGESIPLKVLKTYSDGMIDHYYKTNDILFANPSNIYHTLGDLFEKEFRILYPDIMLSAIQKPYLVSLFRDFPSLTKDLNIFNRIDYEIFEISGYEVQILNDQRSIYNNPSIMQTRGTEGMYYWNIPELKTRSFDTKEGIDKSPWGTGRYPTIKSAIDSAEKYIDYLFYGEVV